VEMWQRWVCIKLEDSALVFEVFSPIVLGSVRASTLSGSEMTCRCECRSFGNARCVLFVVGGYGTRRGCDFFKRCCCFVNVITI